MLIRKDVIDSIGLFDDDFWCYYEETDFCHRVQRGDDRLLGGRRQQN